MEIKLPDELKKMEQKDLLNFNLKLDALADFIESKTGWTYPKQVEELGQKVDEATEEAECHYYFLQYVFEKQVYISTEIDNLVSKMSLDQIIDLLKFKWME